MASSLLPAVCFVLMLVAKAVRTELPGAHTEIVSLDVTVNTGDVCQLHDVIEVKVSRARRPDIILHLRAHDVTGVSTRQIYVMKQGLVEAVRLNQEIVAQKSYLDEQNGAALVIKCLLHPVYTSVVKLEGSTHEFGRQYRLFPAQTWSESLIVSDGHVTADYVMEAMTPAHPRPYTQLQTQVLDNLDDNFLRPRSQRATSRTRRQTTTDYYIDLLPVVDYKLYQRWTGKMSESSQAAIQNALLDYLGQLFASVALRLASLTITDKRLNLRMLNPYIATTQTESPIDISLEEARSGTPTVHAGDVLTAFEGWIGQNSASLPANDHAMLLTGYDIYGSNDAGLHFNITSGLANVGTICQGNKSVSLVEDRGAYQSEGVATHELGHSLGAVHDGHDNACPSSDRFIMTDNFNYAHTEDTLLNPWKFSPCSSTQIALHILSVENNPQLLPCLRETAGQSVTPHAHQTANTVCQDFYGSESFACRGLDVPGIDQVCDTLYCRQPQTDKCVLMAAPLGTCCGNGKSCRLGQCVDADEDTNNVCAMDETCPLGDQPGIIVNGETCEQMSPCRCYTDAVRAKCCDTCARHKINTEGCFYGDKSCSLNCNKQACGTTLDSGVRYSFMCCQTCDNVTCSDTTTLSDPGSDERLLCGAYFQRYPDRINNCYRADVQDACCATCEALRDKTRDDCLYGDRVGSASCKALLKDKTDCTNDEETSCCDTCAKIRATTQSPTTSTGSTESESSPSGSVDTGTTSTKSPDNDQNEQECKGLLCSASSLQAGLILLLCSMIVTLFEWNM